MEANTEGHHYAQMSNLRNVNQDQQRDSMKNKMEGSHESHSNDCQIARNGVEMNSVEFDEPKPNYISEDTELDKSKGTCAAADEIISLKNPELFSSCQSVNSNETEFGKSEATCVEDMKITGQGNLEIFTNCQKVKTENIELDMNQSQFVSSEPIIYIGSSDEEDDEIIQEPVSEEQVAVLNHSSISSHVSGTADVNPASTTLQPSSNISSLVNNILPERLRPRSSKSSQNSDPVNVAKMPQSCGQNRQSVNTSKQSKQHSKGPRQTRQKSKETIHSKSASNVCKLSKTKRVISKKAKQNSKPEKSRRGCKKTKRQVNESSAPKPKTTTVTQDESTTEVLDNSLLALKKYEGRKPLMCGACFHFFIEVDDLKDHMRSVHGFDMDADQSQNNPDQGQPQEVREQKVLLSLSQDTFIDIDELEQQVTQLEQSGQEIDTISIDDDDCLVVGMEGFNSGTGRDGASSFHDQAGQGEGDAKPMFSDFDLADSDAVSTNTLGKKTVGEFYEVPKNCEVKECKTNKTSVKKSSDVKKLKRCTLCNRIFMRECGLAKHMSIHRNKIAKENTVHQNLSAENPSLLIEQPKVTLRKKRTHKCSMCKKTFSTEESLKTHMEIHREKLLFICAICDKAFSNCGLLTRHVTKHKKTDAPKTKTVSTKDLSTEVASEESTNNSQEQAIIEEYLTSPSSKVIAPVLIQEGQPGSSEQIDSNLCPGADADAIEDDNISVVEQNHQTSSVQKKVIGSPTSTGIPVKSPEAFYEESSSSLKGSSLVSIKKQESSAFLVQTEQIHTRELLSTSPQRQELPESIVQGSSSFQKPAEESSSSCPQGQTSLEIQPCKVLLTPLQVEGAALSSVQPTASSENKEKTVSDSSPTDTPSLDTQKRPLFFTLKKKSSTPTQRIKMDRNYKCGICSKTYCTPNTLKSHIRCHQVSKDYECGLCKKTFMWPYLLRVHMKSHNESKLLKCDFCSRTFTKAGCLKLHLDMHARQNLLSCDVCDEKFTEEESLKQHILTHREPYKCRFCEKKFVRKIQWQRHEKFSKCKYREPESERDKRTYKCSICDTLCTHAAALKKHMLKHNLWSLHKCNLCGKGFCSKQSLRSHIMVHNNHKPFKCPVCSKSFVQSSNMKTHMRVHSAAKPFKCNFCEKAFKRKTEWKIHTNNVHLGKRSYRCIICNSTFTQHSHLTTHLRTHSGERPYKCTECHKSFKRSHHLDLHMDTHTDKCPYVCFLCDKKFKREKVLKDHMRVHSGEKPYKCPYCDKRFSHSHTVNTHVRTHTKEMPYVCKKCGAKFRYHSSYKVHVALHYNKDAFKCAICNKKLSTPFTKRLHEKKIHGLKG